MSKKELAKAMFIAGEKPVDIAKKLKYKPNTVSVWACRENWNKDRQIKTNELTESLEDQVKGITELALSELSKLLKSDMKDSDKVAAIRAAMDISGLKREHKTGEIDINNIEVIINQKAV